MKKSCLAMLITSMLIFGTVGIFRRNIALPSAFIAFFRGLTGCLTILPFAGKRILKCSDVPKLMLSGALIGLNWILLFEAYNYTSVSVATLCYYMQPTFLVLLSAVIKKQRLSRLNILCTVISFTGMVLVSGVAESAQEVSLRGIVLGLGAAVLYTAVVMLNMSTKETNGFSKTTVQMGSAALVLLPYLLATGSFSGLTFSGNTLLLLVIMGLVHTGLAYALYFASIPGLSTQTIAFMSYMDPVTALVLSALLLHEKMSFAGALGALFVLGSALVNTVFNEKETKNLQVRPLKQPFPQEEP